MAVEIEVSEQFNELINRNNVQIRSLDALDRDLYDRYLAGGKAVLILRSKVYEKKIIPITEDLIEVESDELAGYVRPGEKLVVVLPGPGKKRFVLQGQVDKIYVDRFRMRFLDPRFNKRFPGDASCVTRFWEVPEVILLKVQNRELRLFRKENGVVIEQLSESESESVGNNDCVNLLGTSPVSGVLVDISCGGLCLRARSGKWHHLVNNLVYVGLDFQGAGEGSDDPASTGMSVKIFAIVRNCRQTPEGDYLHMMFISRLPESCEDVFSIPATEEQEND